MTSFEIHSIIRHIKYYYWCLWEIWDDYWHPPCKECGIKSK